MNTIHNPAYASLLPEDVRENTRRHRTDWAAPFHPADDLRVHTPIVKARVPRKDRQHLAEMSAERRAQLEADWIAGEAAVPSCAEPISAELRERARIEWEQSK